VNLGKGTGHNLEGFHKNAYPSDLLSPREIETLALVLVGFTLRMTSVIQGVTLGTIKKRWQIIKDKLHIGGGPRTFQDRLLQWYEMLSMHTLDYIKEAIKLQIEPSIEFVNTFARELQGSINSQVTPLSKEPLSACKRRLTYENKETTNEAIQQPLTSSAIEIAEVAVKAMVNIDLRSLFDTFVGILYIQSPEQRDSLWSILQRGIIYYLLQSIRPRLAIDIRSLAVLLNEQLITVGQPSEVPQLLSMPTAYTDS
jgi:DNA-binding CsgD family transcriptional regulator